MARSPKKPNPTKPKNIPHDVAALPPRQYEFDFENPLIKELAEKLPGGMVAILANESARYTVFQAACMGLILPTGSRYGFHTGCYVTDSCNRACASLMPHEDWIMFMGDDHNFDPNLVLKLLTHMYKDNLDIVVPVCFKRDFPPTPVLYKYGEAQPGVDYSKYAYEENDNTFLCPINLNAFPEGGLIEVDGAGSAGMIVHRRVLEKMEPPWFRLGVGHWGEDLDFCRRAQKLGFKIYADLDMSLGHIINTTIWPEKTEDGQWGCQYDHGNKGGFFLTL